MTNEEKKLWLVIAVIAVVLFFLAFRKTSITNNTTAATTPAINVDIPSMTLPPRNPITIPSQPMLDFSMISACGCGGSSTPIYKQDASSITIENTVYNNHSINLPASPIQDEGGFSGFVQAPATYGTYDAFGHLHGGNSGNNTPWW